MIGSAGGGAYTSTEYKMETAQKRLLNRTAELGGNFVVMDVAGGDIVGLSLSGRAFSCGAPPPAGPIPVAVVNAVSPPPPAASVEERLQKLRALLTQGLITQEEHDRQKQEILRSL